MKELMIATLEQWLEVLKAEEIEGEEGYEDFYKKGYSKAKLETLEKYMSKWEEEE